MMLCFNKKLSKMFGKYVLVLCYLFLNAMCTMYVQHKCFFKIVSHKNII